MKHKPANVMREFTERLSQSEDMLQILEFIVDRFMQSTASPKAAIDLVSMDGSVDLQVSRGLPRRTIRLAPGEGITGWVLEHQQLLNVPRVTKEPHYQEARSGTRSEMAAPLSCFGRDVGVLNLESSRAGAFKAEDETLLRSFSPYLAAWLYSNRSEAVQLERRNELLKSLVTTGQEIAAVAQHPEEILNHIVEKANKLLGADVSVLHRFDGRTHKFLPNPAVAGHLLQGSLIVKDAPRQTGGMAARVREQGMVVVEDLVTQPEMENSFTRVEDIRSFVAVALKAGRDLIGVLYVNFRAPHRVPKDEQFVIQAFADQAAIAVRKARLLEQFSTLNEIAQRLNRAVEAEDLFRTVYQEVSRLLNAEIFLLAQYQEAAQTMDLWLMDRDDHVWLERQPLRGLTGYVIEKLKRPLLIRDRTQENLPVDPVPIPTKDPNQPRSHLFVPLMVGERVLGVVSVQSYEPNMYGEEEEQLLSTLAAHIAVAMDNLALSGTLERLHSVGGKLTAGTDLKQVLNDIANAAHQDLHADLVYIYRYNAAADEFELPTSQAGELVDRLFPLRQIVTSEDVAYVLVRLGSSHYARDAVNDDEMSGPRETRRPDRFVLRERIVSSAGVLLRSQREIVGIMFVNYRRHQQFDERQQRQIELLANYAASAITRARLFKELQQSLDRRLAELQALSEIDKAITSASLPEVFQKILNAAIEITGNESGRGNIVLVDESGEYLNVPVAERGGEWKAGTRDKFKIGSQGIVGNVAFSKKPALIADLKKEGWWTPWYVEVYPDTRSELAVPMVDEKGKLVGVINLESTRPGAFSAEDQRLLVALAGQGFIAYQSAGRFAAEQRARSELQVLAEIDKAIISTLDQNEVLHLILGKAMELVGAPTGNIMLYDKEKGDLWMAAGHGTLPGHEKARQSLEEGIVGRVVRDLEPLRVADVTAPSWKDLFVPFIGHTRAELAVPMSRGAELVGVLNVESPTVGAFGEDHERLLKALAGQAVIAIQNSERYEGQQRARRGLQVLSDIDKAISGTLQLKETLTVILDKAMELVEAPIGSIKLYDARHNDLYTAVEHGVPPGKSIYRQKLDEGVIGLAAREAHTIRVNDIREPRWSSIFLPENPDTLSELAVPMAREGKLVGVINIENTRPNAFSSEHEKLLTAMADDAVIAVNNAESYQRQRRSKDLVDALRRIDAAIVEGRPAKELMNRVLDEGITLTGAERGDVFLYHPSRAELDQWTTRDRVHEAPPPTQDQQGRVVLRESDSIVGHVVATRQPYVSHGDVQQDPTVYYKGYGDIHSEIAVPISLGDVLVGVLNLECRELNAFSDDHLDLLVTFAGQAAVAIQDARSRERFRVLSEFARDIVNTPLDVDNLLDLALTVAQEHTQAHTLTARWYEPENLALVTRQQKGERTEVWRSLSLKELSANAWVADRRETLYTPNVDHRPAGIPFRRGNLATKSELIVPVVVSDAYFGNLDLEHPEVDAFDENEVQLVEGIAAQLAVAIQRVLQRVEVERADMRRQEAASMAILGGAAAQMTHRFGTNLGAIRGLVQEAQNQLRGEHPDIQASLKEVLDRLLTLMNLEMSLKNLVVLERGQALEKRLVSANSILKTAEESFDYPDSVDVQVKCSEEPLYVTADERIHEVFRNLFTNAVQALERQGEGTVVLSAQSTNGVVLFKVSDNGPGIPADKQSEVWGLFKTSKSDSLGFGLFYVRYVVEEHNGTVSLTSVPGEGTTFEVSLPRTVVER